MRRVDGVLDPESESALDSDGFVQYTIQPLAGLTTGTTMTQQASVVFDTNAPLATESAGHTIDAGTELSSTVTGASFD